MKNHEYLMDFSKNFEKFFFTLFSKKKLKIYFSDSESDMTGAANDENGEGMNQSIIESATREHVYTGFVDPRKCSTCFYRNI